MPTRHLGSALVALLLYATACAPPAGNGAVGSTDQSPARGRKTLTIGIQREPDDFGKFAGSGRFGGAPNVPTIVHDELVVEDDTGRLRPLVATEVPSVESRTLLVKPDGTMDVVWKLRPNARWHDGTPFTSADFLFTLEVLKDPETARTATGARPDLIQAVSAPDRLTIVVHWSTPFATAPEGREHRDLLPAHLLEGVYRADKDAFVNSPYFTTEFVGLGPYRLAAWERGSHIEFARFDAYYRGQPPFDRVIVRFLGDPNTMVANILSGAVDVLVPNGAGIDVAQDMKRQWEGTGNVVRFDVQDQVVHVEIQHRPELARPTRGLINRTVRQALYHAIDRPTLADALTAGLSPVADSWFRPGGALRSSLDSQIPQYPYDPKRAVELLGQAGWARGGEGPLVHTATGERFETQLWTANVEQERVVQVVSDNWQAVGVAAQTYLIPPARAGDAEFGLSYTGGLVQGPSAYVFYTTRLHSNVIASPATRWRGGNRTGYNNPRADGLMDRLAVALDPAEQLSLHGQLLQEMMGDVAIMPLFWKVSAVLHVKGVKTHKLVGSVATWDFFGWDRE